MKYVIGDTHANARTVCACLPYIISIIIYLCEASSSATIVGSFIVRYIIRVLVHYVNPIIRIEERVLQYCNTNEESYHINLQMSVCVCVCVSVCVSGPRS